MTALRVEENALEQASLARLVQAGPVIVTRDGIPLYVVQPATPEWLEAWAAELDEQGDLSLEEYAALYDIPLDRENYLREFPDDAPFTTPDAS